MEIYPKKARFIYFSIIGITLLQLNSVAQTKSKEVNNQNQTWFSVNTTTRLNEKFGVIADLHVRRNNFLADPSFYFARVAVNYWLKENVTAATGYAQLWLAPANPAWRHFARENRIYQQLQITSKVGKIGLVNRLRNEQRWQQKIVNDTFTHKYKFTDRVRYLLSVTVPVFRNPHYPSLVLSDELLIQFGKEIVYNTFEQNRAFIGIKQPIGHQLSFDLGYMLVYQQKASGYQYDKNNTLRCFLYYAHDFRKKK
jgi:hypothetical protein